MEPLRREMQMVFQDPFASLNPRKRVGQIIGTPLRLHGVAARSRSSRKVRELLGRVGLAARAREPLSRTSSPAGSGSASAWPAPSRSSRG